MTRTSWLAIPADSDFSLANLPFGVVSTPAAPRPRPAVAVGDHVLLLAVFAEHGGFARWDGRAAGVAAPRLCAVFAHEDSLNAFAALGRRVHAAVRAYLQDLLADDASAELAAVLRDHAARRRASLVPAASVTVHLPMRIGDYTDFYAGQHHAFRVGCLFRGPAHALQPNYAHLPVGYHGRASSVVVSGTPIRRPWGQILPPLPAQPAQPAQTAQPAASGPSPPQPIHAPSRRLDIELELGAFVCSDNPLGHPVPLDEAEQHIFGYVLLNDWSARDIQAWEYVPLGPFNGKNFASTISPWVVLADALAPFRCAGLPRDPQQPLLPYLQGSEDTCAVFDLQLEVDLATAASAAPTTITRSNGRHLLWSFPQMLAHHTVGGCPLRPGDLLGSGTISGPDSGSEGSLLELTDGGKKDLVLPSSGETRTFLQDGDTVTIRGWCGSGTNRVGFGPCVGRILPAWNKGLAES